MEDRVEDPGDDLVVEAREEERGRVVRQDLRGLAERGQAAHGDDRPARRLEVDLERAADEGLEVSEAGGDVGGRRVVGRDGRATGGRASAELDLGSDGLDRRLEDDDGRHGGDRLAQFEVEDAGVPCARAAVRCARSR